MHNRPVPREMSLATRFRCFICAAIALLAAGGGAVADEATGKKSILLLNSENSEFPATHEFEKGLREGMASPPGTTEFFVEYLDFGRFPEQAHAAELQRHLKERYAGRRLDLVVTMVDSAFEFALAHRASLFPDLPIIAAAVERGTVEGKRLPAGVVSIPTVFDYRGTLELALALQPDAREVVAVHGLAGFDLRRRDEARAVLDAFAPRLRYRMLSGVPLAAMEETVRQLPPGSLVLMLSMVRDAEGRPLVGADYAERLAAASPAPVYSTFASHLRRGALAGAITDWTAIGRATAAAATQSLSGKLPATPAPVDVPLQVNWGALEKWGIAEQRVPREAQVLFRQPGLWDEYRGFVLGAIAAVLLQALLIFGLVVQLRRRHRAQAEQELLRKQQQIEHIGRVSTMGEIAASLAHELSQPLGAILANAQAGLRFLERGNADPSEMREILQEVVADDRRAGEVVGALRAMLRRERSDSALLDLAQLAREVLALLHGELMAQQVEVQAASEPGCLVLANRTRIEQVLVNLLMNGIDAMRGRPAAERRLRVEVSRGQGGVQVAVRDSGVGLPADELGKVFDAFWTTKASGMGMGLAICESIVKSYDGAIGVEPNDGQGVTFRFTLPLAPQAGHNRGQP